MSDLPSIIYKKDLADAIRKGMQEEVVDLMLGKSQSMRGMLGNFYQLISETAGAIDLAYLRGFEDGKKSRERELLDSKSSEGGD